MRRHLLTFLAVVGLSMLISSRERAAGLADAKAWVRTADGWEPRAAVEVTPRTSPPQLHPGLVAAFQLGVSVFSLLAFPARATPAGRSGGRVEGR